MLDETALRAYLERILGWSAGQAAAVESALGALRLALLHGVTIVLLGESDLAPIARELHRRAFGAGQPFVVADPRRGDVPATARTPASRATGLGALHAARGGTLALRLRRLPEDVSMTIGLAREPGADVRVMLLGDSRRDRHPFVSPAPIMVPSLDTRADELGRIVDEYAADATRALGVGPERFTASDRAWVLQHAAESLPVIEAATQRLVALNMSRTTDEASAALGLRGSTLRRWRIQRIRRSKGGGGVRSAGRWMRRAS